MTIPLDPFYPIVDSAAWAELLTRVGSRLIQLRIKNRDADAVLAEVRLALAACARHGAQLVVNDHWRAAIEAKADFIHLGQEDLDEADLKAIRSHGLRLGVSTHDHAELERGLSTDPDYVALGPIYPTTLKAMRFEPRGLERIGEWRRLVGPRPLVAIGGVSLERAPLCLSAGADVVSVVSDVLGHPDPQARAQAWLAATRRGAP